MLISCGCPSSLPHLTKSNFGGESNAVLVRFLKGHTFVYCAKHSSICRAQFHSPIAVKGGDGACITIWIALKVYRAFGRNFLCTKQVLRGFQNGVWIGHDELIFAFNICAIPYRQFKLSSYCNFSFVTTKTISQELILHPHCVWKQYSINISSGWIDALQIC